MRPIQTYQVKNLHILKQKLGLDDETYQAALSAFKAKGGSACESAKDLSYIQAKELTTTWKRQCDSMGVTVNLYRSNATSAPSAGQLDLLRYHAIRCAIHFCRDQVFTADGQVLTGDDLHDYCLKLFRAKRPLPQSILRTYFKAWINPKSNRWLLESGHLNREPKDVSTCFHGELSIGAVQHLIQRFKRVHEEIETTQPTYPQPPLEVN